MRFGKILLISVAALGLTGTASAKVNILGESISSKDVCPQTENSKCVVKSDNGKAQYIGRYPRFITIGDDGKPILSQYLGREFTPGIEKNMNFCGNLSATNLIEDHADRMGVDYLQRTLAHDMNISIKAKKLFSVGADLDAVQVATAAGVPSSQTEAVAAAIKAAYKRVRGRDVSITGRFEFWEINPELASALNAADMPPELQPCRDWLERGKSFVTSLSGFMLDEASLSSELEQGFSASLDASLGSSVNSAQLAAIKAQFASELTQKVQAKFSPSFTLLTISRFRTRPV